MDSTRDQVSRANVNVTLGNAVNSWRHFCDIYDENFDTTLKGSLMETICGLISDTKRLLF